MFMSPRPFHESKAIKAEMLSLSQTLIAKVVKHYDPNQYTLTPIDNQD